MREFCINQRNLPAQLFYEGLYFQATFRYRAEAERMAGSTFTVRPYGIKIKRINPQTGQATEWEFSEGYSVWGKARREPLELMDL